MPEVLYADAEFTAGRVKGFSGCNDYDAIYRDGGRTLLISQAVTTKKACADDVNAFEANYLALLQQSRLFSARSDTLTIFGDGGETILVFDAAPKNPLLGKWNVDSYADAPGSQAVPIEGTELTAVFGIANVGGSSGCNTYDGTYGTNGTVVRIGRLATTRLACPDDVMTQETSFLAALQGASLVERRGTSLILRDAHDDILVAMTRPATAAEPTPSPTAAASTKPTAKPSPSESAKPSASVTPKPSEKPSPTPSPTPTAKPTAKPTTAPTLPPPASIPPEATCTIAGPAGAQLATIVYPKSWFTVTTPASIACRYFDPAAITVPSDPTTLQTAVMITTQAAPYADAVAAATDPANWDVTTTTPVTVSGLPATLVEATSTAEASGLPVGTSRYAYIIDYGVGGTVSIVTTGTAGDAAYTTNTSVVDLIAEASTFTPAT